jgi:hypothetical protein
MVQKKEIARKIKRTKRTESVLQVLGSFAFVAWLIGSFVKSELLAQEKRKKEKRKKRHCSLRPPFLWSTLKVQIQVCVGMYAGPIFQ